METSKLIKAVLWDLGGVIVRTHDWSGRARWEERTGLAPRELERLVFRGEMGVRASLGKADDEDVWVWVLQQLNLAESDRETLRQDFFAGDEVDTTLVDFIRCLRPERKTGLVSNAWPNLRYWMEREWCIADAFDCIVISAEVGILKPDPRIFEMALDSLQVSANQAVFVDDFEVNIHGARKLGLHAIHFQSREQTLSELRELLNLS